MKKVLDLMHIKSVSSAWVFIGAFGLLLLTIVYEQIVSPSGMYAGSEDDMDAFLPVIGLIVISLAYIGISSWALLSSSGRKLLAEHEKISDQTGRTIAWWPKFLFACIAAAFMYALVCIVVPILHAEESAAQNKIPVHEALWRTSLLPYVLGLVSLVPVSIALIRYPSYALHVFHM